MCCTLCHREIGDVATAIAVGQKEDLAHFSCVLEEVTTKETLPEGERVAYLGSGVFGVLRQSEREGFAIVRSITYEVREISPVWRGRRAVPFLNEER